MFTRRGQRITTTLFVVLALLFSQLALANYICPSEPAQAADMSAMDMAPGMPCDEMDMQMDKSQPVLCHQHCLNTPQSFDPINVPSVSFPAVMQVLVVPQLPDAVTGNSRVYADVGQARPPPDPLFLSTLRLRV